MVKACEQQKQLLGQTCPICSGLESIPGLGHCLERLKSRCGLLNFLGGRGVGKDFRFSGARAEREGGISGLVEAEWMGGRGTLDLAESSGQVGRWTSDVVEPKRTGKGEGFHSPFPSLWPLQSTRMKRHFPQAAQAPLLHDARPMTSDARRPTIQSR